MYKRQVYINAGEHEAGNLDFEYLDLPDSQALVGLKETVAEKGFFILPSELFQNVRREAPRDANLNETLERVFKNIEGSAVGTDSEDDLKGLFDDLDVNSGKLGPTVARRGGRGWRTGPASRAASGRGRNPSSAAGRRCVA